MLWKVCKGEAMSLWKDVLDWFTMQENDLLVTAIGTLMAAIVVVLAWVRGGTVPRRFWRWVTRLRPRLPRATLRVFPVRRYPLMSDQGWHTTAVGDHPAMQIVSAWHVTNLAKEAIHIHRARIVRPRKARTDGEVFVIDPHTNRAGDGLLAPRSTAQAITQFFVHPPVCHEGEDFKAKIVFTDQFGNKHKTKWIVFKYYY
jgi:hypothetical protein